MAALVAVCALLLPLHCAGQSMVPYLQRSAFVNRVANGAFGVLGGIAVDSLGQIYVTDIIPNVVPQPVVVLNADGT